jgi:hypothetical protein
MLRLVRTNIVKAVQSYHKTISPENNNKGIEDLLRKQNKQLVHITPTEKKNETKV